LGHPTRPFSWHRIKRHRPDAATPPATIGDNVTHFLAVILDIEVGVLAGLALIAFLRGK
jgi:hypothetical protein